MLEIISMDLNQMFEGGRDRLHRVQRADVRTKKRYLIFSSAAAMILVVLLWFFYLSLTLPKVASTSPEDALPAQVEESDSFFRVLGRGAKNLKDSLVKEFENFKTGVSQSVSSFVGRFKETKEFTIEP